MRVGAKYELLLNIVNNSVNICRLITVYPLQTSCVGKRKYKQEYKVAETDLLVPKICWSASLLWLVSDQPTNM